MALVDIWRITKSKDACSGCGEEFRDNQVFFSGLKDAGQELVRQDFCSACWEESDAPGFFCFWRGRRAAGQQKQVVNTDLMLEFFDRLEGLAADKKVFRFVLALYLMRRKEFKLLEVARADGRETLVFERRRTGDRTAVESPGLTEEQIQDTEAQLSRLLDVCL